MYLSASKYISGWDHGKNEAKAEFAKILEAVNMDSEDIASGSPSGALRLNVMYWRKANAIHAWFVQNVQGGKDDCSSYHVSRNQLKQLSETCRKVLANRDLAPNILSTQSGFFFGPTEYDEYYYRDVQETADQIDKILLDPKYQSWEFSYQSSW